MYFGEKGEVNTDKTLELAYKRGIELGLNEVVVATTTGKTALKALEIFKDFKVTAVTYHCGFKEPFKPVMWEAKRRELTDKGATVISATHALSGVERSIMNKFSGIPPVLLIASTLKLFGQGVKVAVEISIMAADGGALSGNDIISIGGSSRGADAALVIKPANQSSLFDMQIREVICKPRNI